MPGSKTHKSPTGPPHKTSLEDLARNRYEALQRGYLRRTDLKKFVPCGDRKVQRIWRDITEGMKAEGIEQLDGGVILVERAMKYLGLTEKKVIDSYERTIKKG